MGYLGHLADAKLKISFPIFLLLGIIVGLTASVMKLLKQLNDK
jgi:F0F1-type ATP synthase assembly protein I